MVLFWTPSNWSMSFFYWGPLSWLQYPRWTRMRVEQKGTITSFDLLATFSFFLDSPGHDWLFGLQAHIDSSYQIFHLPISHSPLHGSSQFIHPSVSTDIEDFPEPGPGPCTCTCWTSRSSHGPTSEACQVPSRSLEKNTR